MLHIVCVVAVGVTAKQSRVGTESYGQPSRAGTETYSQPSRVGAESYAKLLGLCWCAYGEPSSHQLQLHKQQATIVAQLIHASRRDPMMRWHTLQQRREQQNEAGGGGVRDSECSTCVSVLCLCVCVRACDVGGCVRDMTANRRTH